MISISNVKPEEKLIGDILLDIENWLKELYVFEHQKSFSIPFTAAISSFKTSMKMLMNLNPNVQAKVLSLEEMEKMNHTCVAKICSLFHKKIAGIKAIVDSSVSKSQIANETDVVIASVHYSIVAFKEKDGLGYRKLAGEMCDSIYSFYDNRYTNFEVDYKQGPHDEYSFNEGKSLSKNPREIFTYHISKKLPTFFLKFDDVYKQAMKALQDELKPKIEGSKNLSTAEEYNEILKPFEEKLKKASLDFTLATVESMQSYIENMTTYGSNINRSMLFDIVWAALVGLNNYYGENPQGCSWQFLDERHAWVIVNDFKATYPAKQLFGDAYVQKAFKVLFKEPTVDWNQAQGVVAKEINRDLMYKEKHAKKIINGEVDGDDALI